MNVENNEAEQSINDSPDNADEVVEQEQTDEGAATGEKGENKPRYWLYSPGKNGKDLKKNWADNLARGEMAIGFGDLGNLIEKYNNPEEIRQALIEKRIVSVRTKSAPYVFNFSHVIKRGDVVFVREGQKFIIGRGVVEDSKYKFEQEQDRGDFKHVRKVQWERSGSGKYISKTQLPLIELTDEKCIDELKKLVDSDSFNDVTPADGQNNEDEGQAAKAEATTPEEPKQKIIYQLDYSKMLHD